MNESSEISVLVVDDASFMRLTLKKILLKYNFNVVAEAPNGKIAIDKYKHFKPSLTLMDLQMPEMDGTEAIKKIKEIDPYARIVVCSTVTQKIKVMDAIAAGAGSYVIKPFKEEKLINEINKIFENTSSIKIEKKSAEINDTVNDESFARGAEEGFREGVTAIIKHMSSLGISSNDIAKYAGLSLDEVNEYLSL